MNHIPFHLHLPEFTPAIAIDACQCPALRESAEVHILTRAVSVAANGKLYTVLLIWFHSRSVGCAGAVCVHFHHIGIAHTNHRKLELLSSRNPCAVETSEVRRGFVTMRPHSAIKFPTSTHIPTKSGAEGALPLLKEAVSSPRDLGWLAHGKFCGI